MVADGNWSSYIYEPAPPQPLLPSVDVDVIDGWANESPPHDAVFLISRIGSTASALTVRYTVGGTATSGSDYEPLPGEVTIRAGDLSAEVTVTALDDQHVDPYKTVVLTLSPDPAYVVGTPATGTITIQDDDAAPMVTVVASDPAASENVPPALPVPGVFTINRDGNTNDPLEVYFTVSGTAITNDI